jgi:hypothetical protein
MCGRCKGYFLTDPNHIFNINQFLESWVRLWDLWDDVIIIFDVLIRPFIWQVIPARRTQTANRCAASAEIERTILAGQSFSVIDFGSRARGTTRILVSSPDCGCPSQKSDVFLAYLTTITLSLSLTHCTLHQPIPLLASSHSLACCLICG